MNRSIRLALVGAVICLSVAAKGAEIAFDSAGDSAYNNGWTQGSNGGFGWGGGWSFSIDALVPPIIGDSTTNSFGAPDGTGDINSPRTVGGRAWGLPLGFATRAFNGPLSLGQTFSIDLDDNGTSFFLNHQSSVYLLAPGGVQAVGVRANILDNYRIETPSGSIQSGVPETAQGIHITFTELSSGVEVSLTPYIAGATTTTTIVPYTGQLSGIEFDSQQLANTFPAQFTPYINNIAITPEPSGLGLLALPGLAARRRRR